MFFLLSLFVSPASSGGIDYGLKLGLNLASFTGNDISNHDKKAGVAAGLYFEKGLSSSLSFQIEALYSQKGDKGSFFLNDSLVNSTNKIEYLEVPLLWKLRPREHYDVNLFFNAGLVPAWKISSRHIEESFDTLKSGEIVNLRNFDLGLLLAWGFDIKIGSNKSSLEFRITRSLENIYENEDKFLDIKNSVISVLISSNFRKFT